ncbi:hypothetical protein CGLO_13677 [Colletotrichum gloeosporioides Cg-14]
MDSPL